MSFYRHSNNFWQQQAIYDKMNGVTRDYPGGPAIRNREAPPYWIAHEKIEHARAQRTYTPSARILGETWLYRYFSGDELLYIGITCNREGRRQAHAKCSKWFSSHDRVEYQKFSKRDLAYSAEEDAIKAEKPRWNIIHNTGRTA